MKGVLIQANAKINLEFKILGKLENGYHQIESIFQSVDLADFLLIEKSKENQITGAIVCSETENIIFKAKRELEKYIGKKLPARIHLQKTIPISAGLGGGSADAGATILGLNLIYHLKLSKQNLVEIGKRVGADVPFFFYGGTCKVEGIGEKIKPIKKSPSKYFVLFRPHKRVETKMMYELYDKTGKDFFVLNQEICPDTLKVKEYFESFNLKGKLSGSGPTVFCEVKNYQIAKKVAEGFPTFNGDIFICSPKKQALEIIKKY